MTKLGMWNYCFLLPNSAKTHVRTYTISNIVPGCKTPLNTGWRGEGNWGIASTHQGDQTRCTEYLLAKIILLCTAQIKSLRNEDNIPSLLERALNLYSTTVTILLQPVKRASCYYKWSLWVCIDSVIQNNWAYALLESTSLAYSPSLDAKLDFTALITVRTKKTIGWWKKLIQSRIFAEIFYLQLRFYKLI